MRECNRYTEEILIDYVNDEISEKMKAEVTNHLSNCQVCEMTVQSWRQILQLEYEKGQLQITPSSELKNRVMRSIRVIDEQKRHEKRRYKTLNKKFAFRFSTLAAALLLVIGLFQYTSNDPLKTHDRGIEVLHNDEIKMSAIETLPHTNQLSITPLMNEKEMEGNVWLNPVKNEMLLEIRGLKKLPEADYQVWFIDIDDVMNGEILRIVNGTSRIFYRGMDVNNLKLIKGSVEPLGGSVRPTGPETFIIELKR